MIPKSGHRFSDKIMRKKMLMTERMLVATRKGLLSFARKTAAGRSRAPIFPACR